MIYVIWKNSDLNVIHGWDTCSTSGSSIVDYKDADIVHGPVAAGGTSSPKVVNLTTSKFPGATGEPTQPITNCKFVLRQYYDSTNTAVYNIPTEFGSYTFCDGNSSYTVPGYTGSFTAPNDFTLISTTWPALSCGLSISQDGNCEWTPVDSSGVTLSHKAGGSESSNDGEVSPGYNAQVSFKVKIPSDFDGGTIQFLTALEYTFTE